VFAVNMPEHAPAPGHAQFSISFQTALPIWPLSTLGILANIVLRSMGSPSSRPASIGPPLQTMAGILSLAAPMTIPGTILSQLGMSTRPSNGCARAIISTESATSSRLPSEYFIPSWFMAMPSQTPIVPNMIGVPPAMRIPSLTAWAILSRWIWPGIISLNAQAMPTSGAASSLSVKPIALNSERWGPFATPSTITRLRLFACLLEAFFISPFLVEHVHRTVKRAGHRRLDGVARSPYYRVKLDPLRGCEPG